MKPQNSSFEEEKRHLNDVETFTRPLDELAEKLQTNLDQGLSQEEAEKRLRTAGPNTIPRVRPSLFRTYIAPFMNTLITVYLITITALAILAYFLVRENWRQVIYWLAIISVNALIAVIQQARSQAKIETLARLSATKGKAVREGKPVEVDPERIVPGDIIRLRQGDRVPADARIIEASNLKINEASLTGESEEVEKYPGTISTEECETPSSIRNMAFLGTYVTTGSAAALVTQTGKNTQIGKISTTLRDIGTREILLRTKVNKIAKYLAVAVLLYSPSRWQATS